MIVAAFAGRRNFVVVFSALSFLIFAFWSASGSAPVRRTWAVAQDRFSPASPAPQHPIDRLMVQADEQFSQLASKQTKGVREAAAAYRRARGRHPPPKFDQYVKWCEQHDVMMIEDFYDPMYRDLGPFWGVPTKVMRDFPLKDWSNTISIRNGTTFRKKDTAPNIIDWIGKWEIALKMLPIETLPDVDLAFNVQDESKLFVPWDTVNKAFQKGESERLNRAPGASTVREYQSLGQPPDHRVAEADRTTFTWAGVPEDEPLWRTAREACPPDTEARLSSADEDYTKTITWPDPTQLSYMHYGFVANYTSAKSVCDNPFLRSLHGVIVAMNAIAPMKPDESTKAITRDLVPMLAGSKLNGIGADILVPPGVQMGGQHGDAAANFEFNTANRTRWEAKQSSVLWRGSASGGLNNGTNWTRFHRHRFMAATNSTLYAMTERMRNAPLPDHAPTAELTYNFPLTPFSYDLAYLGADDPASAVEHWASQWQDTGFTHLMCWPPGLNQLASTNQDCPYNGMFYTVVTPTEPHEKYNHKYIPDIDGFAFSGRFRGLLMSNSVPMKATIYDTWDDARLIPWKHFVPMDNTNMDWYPLMEYFMGYSALENEHVEARGRERPPHDAEARKIAEEGAQWADRVDRHQDQLAWFYRLILEMARLSDDRRVDMGFDDDLRDGLE